MVFVSMWKKSKVNFCGHAVFPPFLSNDFPSPSSRDFLPSKRKFRHLKRQMTRAHKRKRKRGGWMLNKRRISPDFLENTQECVGMHIFAGVICLGSSMNFVGFYQLSGFFLKFHKFSKRHLCKLSRSHVDFVLFLGGTISYFPKNS